MDRISEFLTRIRNAGLAGQEKVDVPSSNERVGIAKVLEETGFIKSFKVAKDGKQGMMRIQLKYNDLGKHSITSLDRSSRPGKRVYVGKDQVPVVRSGLGLAILSTNKGIMSSKAAAANKLGGELICTVW